MAITMLMAGYSPKLKYLAHSNYNVNGRLQPKTEIFGPTGNVVQYFFLLGRWYTGLRKKKNLHGVSLMGPRGQPLSTRKPTKNTKEKA